MTATIALAGAAFVSRAQADEPLDPAGAAGMLGAAISRVIEHAIPAEYDKQQDWGATKEIPVGVRTTGKGWHAKLSARKRSVNHGVWKHYRLRLRDPQQDLSIALTDLRPAGPGRLAFRLEAEAAIDAWARAKAYEYGVHVIALEVESDLRARLTLDGELGVRAHADDGYAAITLDPVIHAARVELIEFRVRRVSNARGPVVRELGSGLRRLVEDELNGPQLVDKLNRAIDKRRDRLSWRPAELLETERWPVAVRAWGGSAASVLSTLPFSRPAPDAPAQNAPAAASSP